jgi:hypothetical protein
MTLPEAQRLLESGAATYLAGLNVPGANRS